MDCYKFLKNYVPSTIPQPFFFSGPDCNGMKWSMSSSVDFQETTNSVLFNYDNNSLQRNSNIANTSHSVFELRHGRHFVAHIDLFNPIRSIIVPQHYTVTITKAIVPKSEHQAAFDMFIYSANIQVNDREILFRFSDSKSYPIRYVETITTRSITLNGTVLFNAGDNPFFEEEWLKYTYQKRRVNVDGAYENLPSEDVVEYFPNSINYPFMGDPLLPQRDSDLTNTPVYLAPPSFGTPYIYNVKKEKVLSFIKSITITCNKTEEQHKYDSCVRREPWYIGDIPFYLPISECETYITNLCTTTPNDIACTCLREEKLINNPELPVICFGPKCLEQGFIFRRMMDRDCKVDICQQLINVQGANNYITGSHHITCGHQNFSKEQRDIIERWAPTLDQEAKTNEPYITTTPIPEQGLCNWHVILLIASSFLLCMWLPIIIVYIRKRQKIRRMNAPQRT
jgi:hypothetical protein